MTYAILGAGMAGLLAGVMLRNKAEIIYEAQKSLPNNHHALLRFRTGMVGDVVGVPFKPVKVMKAVVPFFSNPLADALAYSKKATGTASLRSVITAGGDLVERYISPPNFIVQMAERVSADIALGTKIESIDSSVTAPVISTLPMGTLMDMLGYRRPVDFEYRSGTVVTTTVSQVDVYATLYYPGPKFNFYRASFMGDQLTIEYAGLAYDHTSTLDTLQVLQSFGLENSEHSEPEVKDQKYAKILPIDDIERKRFINWATDHHHVYSLGRFATWRPGLLLDDLVHDIRVIEKIQSHGVYDYRK